MNQIVNNDLPKEISTVIENLDINKIDPRLLRREKYYDIINYLLSIKSDKSLPMFGSDDYRNLLIDLYSDTTTIKTFNFHTITNFKNALKFINDNHNSLDMKHVHKDYLNTLYKDIVEIGDSNTLYNLDMTHFFKEISIKKSEYEGRNDINKYFVEDKTPVQSVLSTPKNNITPKASTSKLTLDDQNNNDIKEIGTIDDFKIPSPPLPPLLSSILSSEKLDKLDKENNKNPFSMSSLLDAIKNKPPLKKNSITKDASAPTHSGRVLSNDDALTYPDTSSFKNIKDKLLDKPSFEDNLKLKGKELFSSKVSPQHTSHDDELARRLSIRRKHMIDDNTSPTVQPSNMNWDDDETPPNISSSNINEIKITKYEEDKRQFELNKQKFLEDKEKLKLDREEMNNKLKTLYPDNKIDTNYNLLTTDNLDKFNQQSEDIINQPTLPEINLKSQEINPLRLKKVKGINPFSRKSYEQDEPTFEQNLSYLNKSLNDKSSLSHELNNKLIDGDIFYNPVFKKYVKFKNGEFKEHIFHRLDNSDNQSTISLETQTEINVPISKSRNDENFLHFILKKVRTRKGGDEVTPSDIRFVSETSDTPPSFGEGDD